MDVTPDPLSEDWFWVQSRSRPGLQHLVDVAYQDEPWRKPYEACSCEGFTINLHTMGKTCPHIKAVRKWRKQMNTCPYSKPKLRADLPPMPSRIGRLPVGKNGYPIPFFVAEVNGSREDFRIADPAKIARCIKERVCWVCGEPCGIYLAFVIGPMCTINKLSADPFMHLDCAVWSVRACPFLVRPNMVRREDETTEEMEKNVGGIMIKRNPGVMAVWVTKTYKLELDPEPNKCPLFRLGNPESLAWFREGRPATRAEILEAIQSGMPLLREKCVAPEEIALLDQMHREAMRLLPLE